MPASSTIDIESEAFALRLANLLRATRFERSLSFRALARASAGRFTRLQLRQFEEAEAALDEDLVDALSSLYGADLGTILPSRLPVSITSGVISAGGVEAAFVAKSATSLLTAYLRLIRTMRRQKKAPVIALRREDIDVLAEYLDEPGETIVDRLTALMGATLTQRTAMATMFATGAIVIGLAGSTAARAPETSTSPASGGDHSIEIVVPSASSTTPESATDVATDVGSGDAEHSAFDDARSGPHSMDELDAPPPVETTPTTVAPVVASPVTTAAVHVPAAAPFDPAIAADVPATDASVPDAADTAGTEPAVTDPAMPADVPVTTDPVPDLTWLDGVVGADIPTSAVITGGDAPTDTVLTPVPTVPVVPPDVATDAPPVPPTPPQSLVAVASEAPVPGQAVSLVATSTDRPEVQGAGQGHRAESKQSAELDRRARKIAKRNAVALRRIDARAKAAIERAVNRIYAEADDERVAALQVIDGKAAAALARTAKQLGSVNARPILESVKEEIFARADADKEDALDAIYTRALAHKTAAIEAIEAQASAARAGLGLS